MALRGISVDKYHELQKPKDTMLLAVDCSNGEDFSYVSFMCSNCDTIIESHSFNNEITMPLNLACPQCGTKFKYTYVNDGNGKTYFYHIPEN